MNANSGQIEGLSEPEMETLGRFRMGQGVGNYKDQTACVMACAVALWRMRHGEQLGEATDELRCVCPVLRRLAIRLNDGNWWPGGDEERTKALLPLVPRLLDTKDREKTTARMFRVADWAAREMAPAALEKRGRAEDAQTLRNLPPIVDKDSALAACEIAREISRRLWGCYIFAADAADAAADAAAAAADADAAAADAAADADADACGMARVEYRDRLLALVGELLAI